MHERTPKDAPATVRRKRAPPPTPAAGLVTLQRAVGNRGMALLLRQPAPAYSSPAALATPELGSADPAAGKGRQDMVFIMGSLSDGFYGSAHVYYK